MTGATPRSPRLPPRFLVVSIWFVHRATYRLSGGRIGLWRPKQSFWGTMRLTTIGRRSGRERKAILAYYEDGPNLVTMAMNGWSEGEPAWWLNLQAHPDATVELPGRRAVRGRAAQGAEHDRLWARWRTLGDGLDGFATRRPSGTAVVILEPRTAPADVRRGQSGKGAVPSDSSRSPASRLAPNPRFSPATVTASEDPTACR